MKIIRQTKIITEIERKFSLSLQKKRVSFFCQKCNAQTEMLTINEAASLIGKNWRKIVEQIKTGKFHSFETQKGEIFICAKSFEILRKGEIK